MSVIQAAHYGEAEARLAADPIVIEMAAEMGDASPRVRATWTHPNGSPTHKLMGLANAEYDRRGGKNQAHIGAVATALLRLLAAGEEGRA